MKILVTGAAGFIGMHVSQRLLARGDTVIGIDNLNNYYDPALKHARLENLYQYDKFKFIIMDIADRSAITKLFQELKFDAVVHLAAQAGVRFSIENPHAYVDSNLVGFVNILEGCRHYSVKHLVYASSSSVYGGNTKLPFEENDRVDHPVSLYAATKKANELIAHSYSNLYGLPTTGLRFFTVYGPWGRPDMAPWLFTNAISEERYIKIYNNGLMKRDFTYIDDIAEGTVRVLDHIPINSNNSNMSASKMGKPFAPYKIYNIGGNQPVELIDFINKIEVSIGKVAIKKFLPMQLGDVVATYASVDSIKLDIGFSPSTDLSSGINKWVNWYENSIARHIKQFH